jgi:multiple sugar transport system substrate-binding protein
MTGATQALDTERGWRGVRRSRRWMIGGLTASVTTMLGACMPAGGPDGGTAGKSAAALTGKLLWEGRNTPTYAELAKQALPLFKQRAPGVEVEYMPKSGDWVAKNLATMAAGTGPDVFTAWDEFIWQYAAKGVTTNINPLLRDYKKAELDDFVKGQWDGLQIPGTQHRFGMPVYAAFGVVFYNKNSFRRAGVPEPTPNWTIDEYAEKARRVTRMDGDRQVYGVGHMSTNWQRVQEILWAFGARATDPRDLTKSAFHTPEAQRALDWLYDRYWRDNSWIQVKQRPTPWQWWNAVGNGTIAMGQDGTNRLNDFARMDGVEWDIAPMPKGSGAKMGWIGSDVWGLWKETKAKDASWELIRFLTSNEYLKLQSKVELLTPSRVSLLDDWQQTLLQNFPSLQKVNLKVLRDALTTTPAIVRTFEQLPCSEGTQKASAALNEVFGEGTGRPNVFLTRRGEIDVAAAGCGASFRT